MNCSKCNSPVDDGLNFCEKCGTKVEREKVEPVRFCTTCGKAIENDEEFCVDCKNKNDAKENDANENDAKENDETIEHQEIDDDKKIVATTSFCKECGRIVPDGETVCDSCKKLNEETKTDEENKKPAKNKNINKIAIAVVALVVVVLGILFLVNSGNKNTDVIFYIKDKELVVMDQTLRPIVIEDGLTGGEENQDELISFLYGNTILCEDKSKLYFPKFEVDKNGDVESFTYNYLDLKKYKLSKINEKSVEVLSSKEVDDEGFYPAISEDGKYVHYYLDGDLYLYNQKEDTSKKIKSGIDLRNFVASNDGTTVYYIDEDNNFRVIFSDGYDDNLLDKEVNAIAKFDRSENIVYYTKETEVKADTKDDEEERILYALYKSEGGDESVLVDDNVIEVIPGTTEDGKFYYSKLVGGNEVSLFDFINDDLIEEDNKIGDPLEMEKPIYPDRSDFKTSKWKVSSLYDGLYKKDLETLNKGGTVLGFSGDEITTVDALRKDYLDMDIEYNSQTDEMGKWESNAVDTEAYNKALEEYKVENEKYQEAYDKVSGRVVHDEFRKEFKDTKITLDGESLYCYDGKKSELVTNTLKESIAFSKTNGALVYQSYNLSNEKDNLLDFSTIVEEKLNEDIVEVVCNKLAENIVMYNGNSKVIEGDYFIGSPKFDVSSENLYFENYDEESGERREDYEIYKLDIKNAKVSVYCENEDEDIELDRTNESDNMFYILEDDETSGSIFLENEEIATDVYLEYFNDFDTIYNFPDSDTFIYYDSNNFDNDDDTSELKITNNGKEDSIASDVKIGNFTVLDDNVIYISDGELYSYNLKSEKSKLIDEDAIALTYSQQHYSWSAWSR